MLPVVWTKEQAREELQLLTASYRQSRDKVPHRNVASGSRPSDPECPFHALLGRIGRRNVLCEAWRRGRWLAQTLYGVSSYDPLTLAGFGECDAAVAEWRRQRREVFVPLTYRPGDLAEVDFFEVLVDIDGTRRKAWLFLMRLMYSGRDFAWIYARQDQISFLDGHVRAFTHFAGVPARVAYDNLRAAVVRILVGGARTLTVRFAALASHYLIEACFCRPGEGHDKGGVEARGKAVRQQALVPIPNGATLATINAALLAHMDARLASQRNAVGQTISDRFTEEQRSSGWPRSRLRRRPRRSRR
jgi:hypothetical protein